MHILPGGPAHKSVSQTPWQGHQEHHSGDADTSLGQEAGIGRKLNDFLEAESVCVPKPKTLTIQTMSSRPMSSDLPL